MDTTIKLSEDSKYFRFPTQTIVGQIKSNSSWKRIVLGVAPLFKFAWEYFFNFYGKILYLFSPYRGPVRNTLKNRSIEIIRENKEFLDFGQNLYQSIPSSLLEKNKNELVKRTDELAYYKTLQTQISEETRLELIKFGISDTVLKMVLPYFGVIPRLNSIQLMYNIVHPTLKEVGSKEWHQDDGYYKSLNIFMCISNVDENSGYYRAVDSKINGRHGVIPLDKVDMRLSPWENQRVPEKRLFEFFPKENVISLMGPPGTAALVDNGTVYHKGGFCISKDRIMIQYHFSTESHITTPSVAEQLGIGHRTELNAILNSKIKRYIMGGTDHSWIRKTAVKWKNPVYLIGRRILCYYLQPLKQKKQL